MRRKFLDENVAELDVAPMAQQSDMPALAQHSGMSAQDLAVGHIGEIAVHDGLTVKDDLDAASEGGDFIMVPLAHLVERAAFGGEDFVKRAAILAGVEMGVLRVVVVENLHLVARVGEIVGFKRDADADAIIGAGSQFEIHAQDVIGEDAVGNEIVGSIAGRGDEAIGDKVRRAGSFVHFRPALQRLAVEEGNKAFVLLRQALCDAETKPAGQHGPIHNSHKISVSIQTPRRPPVNPDSPTLAVAMAGRAASSRQFTLKCSPKDGRSRLGLAANHATHGISAQRPQENRQAASLHFLELRT